MRLEDLIYKPVTMLTLEDLEGTKVQVKKKVVRKSNKEKQLTSLLESLSKDELKILYERLIKEKQGDLENNSITKEKEAP